MPIDDAAPARRLAQQLRDLRYEAGQPSYRMLSDRCGMSPAVLSQAASGQRLPTLEVVLAYVHACGGGSEQAWRQRWQAARQHFDKESGTQADQGAPVTDRVIRDRAIQDKAVRDRAIHDVGTTRAQLPLVSPDGVSTPAELATALRSLVERSHLTYSDLERLSGGKLPKSTISDLLAGRHLPTWDTANMFINTCQPSITAKDLELWRSAWLRARASAGERTSQTVPRMPMSACNAYELGVHKAYSTDADSTLPTYVVRDFDRDLRTAVRDARERGGFIVLVGGSGVGKTRSAYEAAQAVVPDFGVLHPADVDELRTIPPARTIVWLDELSRYLHSSDLTAATVHAMLRSPGPVIVVGTLWPQQLHTFTALPGTDQPDSYHRQRQVLKLATVFDVSAELSDREMVDANHVAAIDRRIAACLSGTDGSVFQVLAAGPHLVRRWKNAASPAAAAVISAAIDARRTTGVETIKTEILRHEAPNYLSSTQRARLEPGWFEEALAYAIAPVSGGVAALMPVVDDLHPDQVAGYRPAELLAREDEPDRVTGHHLLAREHELARMRARQIDGATAGTKLAEQLLFAHRQIGKPNLGELSDRVGYSKATLSMVFNNKMLPTWGLVRKLGNCLNVPQTHVMQEWLPLWIAADMHRRADRATTAQATVPMPAPKVPAPDAGAGVPSALTDPGPTGYPCPKCGSWVANTRRHATWHMEQEPAGQRAPEAESTGAGLADTFELNLLREALNNDDKF